MENVMFEEITEYEAMWIDGGGWLTAFGEALFIYGFEVITVGTAATIECPPLSAIIATAGTVMCLVGACIALDGKNSKTK